MRNTRVSIIINLTERDARLPRLLQSILRQEEQVGHVEILIAAPESLPVNDLTVWDTILEHGSVRIAPLPSDMTAGEAKNRTISLATGSHILCLRPDYRLDPQYFSTILPRLEASPEISIVYADYIRLPQKYSQNTVKSGYVPLPDFSHELLRTGNILGPAVLFKNEVWQESEGFRDNTVYSEWDFWIQAALRGYEFSHVSYPLSSCEHRATSFRERAEDAGGKALVVINNQGYFHMHTVRWALAFLRGDAWASSWAFMRLPGPMDVTKMMFEHNIQRMGGTRLTNRALGKLSSDHRSARTI